LIDRLAGSKARIERWIFVLAATRLQKRTRMRLRTMCDSFSGSPEHSTRGTTSSSRCTEVRERFRTRCDHSIHSAIRARFDHGVERNFPTRMNFSITRSRESALDRA
jgi:hypothetical protein